MRFQDFVLGDSVSDQKRINEKEESTTRVK